MKKISAIGISGMLMMLCSCTVVKFNDNKIVAQGEDVTKEYTLTAFNKVDVSQNYDVEIVKGDQYSAVVKVPADIVDYVDVSVKDNCLVISYVENVEIEKNDKEFKVLVTMPGLTGANASGQSRIVSRMTGYEDLEVDCSGQAEFEFDSKAVTCSRLKISVSGQSEVEANDIICKSFDAMSSGQAEIEIDSMTADVVDAASSGQAEIRFGRLDCGTASASASGQSQIKADNGKRGAVQQKVSGQASVML